ncbi:Uncharacterised protein [Acinetobacter phage MD-2021a]|nr:Uncharacterised protein [Acinetobacter phage MD-2021a]CAH1088977.1 Uncharacterised protein [Acinetobacter phage MD-2021a]
MKIFEVVGSVTNGFNYEIEAETECDARCIAYDLADAEFGYCDSFDVDAIYLLEDGEE